MPLAQGSRQLGACKIYITRKVLTPSANMTAGEIPAAYVGRDSFFGGRPPLPQEAGYAIVLGVGVFLSLFTTIMVYMDKVANGTAINIAGRNVKTGLTASVIVSQWTWVATLLQSSNAAWNYGVSGPFWYAVGATISIVLFGILATELKRRARTCHTVCELVYVRWGKAAHLTFIFCCLVANVIVTSMLLLGGAATVNALTGVDAAFASFLIPWGVILYTAASGLKGTFAASYVETTIVFLALVVCVYTVYVKEYSSDLIYDSLQAISGMTESECVARFMKDGVTFYEAGTYSCGPVVENNSGSYVTMLSMGGLKSGIISIVGNFGTVFADQSYWQSAIVAKSANVHKGYLLGSMVWFIIPFALATSLGLAGVALGLPITAGEAGSGLVPSATAVHLFGDFGAVMMASMLFMIITSTGSAQGNAVSSLICYDVYRRYINPSATSSQILKVSQAVIVVFGLGMGALGVALNHMGLNLGWVYQFTGIAIGSAVVPLWNVLMWKDANATGAVAAVWGGMILALATWLTICQAEFGEITVDNLGTLNPNLGGNIVALCSSALIHVGCSLASPQNYDFEPMGQIDVLEGDLSGLGDANYSPELLAKAKAWLVKYGLGFTILIAVVWPVLSLPAGVFTKDYWIFWVFVSISWAFIATVTIIFLPLYESRGSILGVFMFMLCLKKAEKAEPAKSEEAHQLARSEGGRAAGGGEGVASGHALASQSRGAPSPAAHGQEPATLQPARREADLGHTAASPEQQRAAPSEQHRAAFPEQQAPREQHRAAPSEQYRAALMGQQAPLRRITTAHLNRSSTADIKTLLQGQLEELGEISSLVGREGGCATGGGDGVASGHALGIQPFGAPWPAAPGQAHADAVGLSAQRSPESCVASGWLPQGERSVGSADDDFMQRFRLRVLTLALATQPYSATKIYTQTPSSGASVEAGGV
ncbi:unnamed protein product [Prorocentrum cordatum]|uniref:Urea transporter n=1 Tax=Prorocentrum cordatum TaxID=2364126 RepID=A0ABN9RY34_9DINO|nr:unnamed protein product [Polarella glacialis]